MHYICDLCEGETEYLVVIKATRENAVWVNGAPEILNRFSGGFLCHACTKDLPMFLVHQLSLLSVTAG
jgi:hypothetical protein